MQDRIVATSSRDDLRHGENGIRAVQGGYAISMRKNGDDLGIAIVESGADLNGSRWALTRTDLPNVYAATPA